MKERKEVLFRGDPMFQILSTHQAGNKIIYLNEDALSEIKSYSDEIDYSEVNELFVSKLSKEAINYKYLGILERRGTAYEKLPEMILAYSEEKENEYKIEALFSKRMEYIAPKIGEKLIYTMTYSNIKTKTKKQI